ncbi:hypothetical protein Ciccas_004400 [Cichlidogyrus casuarinus]|uniref:F-actin binding domain-containing protein n=1 Tax=Cichlidogyrus casuarinus TaxID=1844966 RepID=A0ABD2QBR2_9PLAT
MTSEEDLLAEDGCCNSLGRRQLGIKSNVPQPPLRTTPMKPARPVAPPSKKVEDNKSTMSSILGRKRPQGPGRSSRNGGDSIPVAMTTSTLAVSDSSELDDFFCPSGNRRALPADPVSKAPRSCSGDEILQKNVHPARPVSMIAPNDFLRLPRVEAGQCSPLSGYVRKFDSKSDKPVLPNDFQNELKRKLIKKQQQVTSEPEVASSSAAPLAQHSIGCFTLPRKRSLRSQKGPSPDSSTSNISESLSRATNKSESNNHKSTSSPADLQYQSGVAGNKVSKRKSWTAGSAMQGGNSPASTVSSGYASSGGPQQVVASPYGSTRLPTLLSNSSTKLDQLSAVMSVPALLRILHDLADDIRPLVHTSNASQQVTHDQVTLIADRLDQCRLGCINFVDNAQCKAVAKFKFRDQCAQLQSLQKELSKPGTKKEELMRAMSTLEALGDAVQRLSASEAQENGVAATKSATPVN